MYTTTAPRVRDEPAAYGPYEVDSDEFPAARVLEDLAEAPEADVPRILARFAALRSWLLRDGGADPDFVDHAVLAARAYLDAIVDWPGAEPLARLTEPTPPLDAAHTAATSAERAGHVEGASALLRAGYLAARRRGDIAGAAELARAVAGLLDRHAKEGVALWTRRADRLGRFDGS